MKALRDVGAATYSRLRLYKAHGNLRPVAICTTKIVVAQRSCKLSHRHTGQIFATTMPDHFKTRASNVAFLVPSVRRIAQTKVRLGKLDVNCPLSLPVAT